MMENLQSVTVSISCEDIDLVREEAERMVASFPANPPALGAVAAQLLITRAVEQLRRQDEWRSTADRRQRREVKQARVYVKDKMQVIGFYSYDDQQIMVRRLDAGAPKSSPPGKVIGVYIGRLRNMTKVDPQPTPEAIEEEISWALDALKPR